MMSEQVKSLAASLLPLTIHDEEYCPGEIWGALDISDGGVRGTHVCTVHGDDPLPISQIIIEAVNSHDSLVKQRDALVEALEKIVEAALNYRGAVTLKGHGCDIDASLALGSVVGRRCS